MCTCTDGAASTAAAAAAATAAASVVDHRDMVATPYSPATMVYSDFLLRAGTIASLVVAVLHVLFVLLEFFKNGVMSLEKHAGSVVKTATRPAVKPGTVEILYTNQAVYNLVFTAGLAWAARYELVDVQVFLLASVVAVGVFGAVSALQVIWFVQVLPAVVALLLTEIGRKGFDDFGVLGFTAFVAVLSFGLAGVVKRGVKQLYAKTNTD